MFRNALTALALLALLMAPSAVLASAAEEESEYARRGWYVGGGFVVGFDKFDDVISLEPDDVTDLSTGFGGNVWVGYRLLKWLAAEVSVEYIDRWNHGRESDSDRVLRFGTLGDIVLIEDDRLIVKANGLTFSGNFRAYPFPNGRFQPYFLAGVGGTRIEPGGLNSGPIFDEDGNQISFPDFFPETEFDFSARFGGGFDLYATPKLVLGINTSYVLTTGKLEGLDYISLMAGVQYRF